MWTTAGISSTTQPGLRTRATTTQFSSKGTSTTAQPRGMNAAGVAQGSRTRTCGTVGGRLSRANLPRSLGAQQRLNPGCHSNGAVITSAGAPTCLPSLAESEEESLQTSCSHTSRLWGRHTWKAALEAAGWSPTSPAAAVSGAGAWHLAVLLHDRAQASGPAASQLHTPSMKGAPLPRQGEASLPPLLLRPSCPWCRLPSGLVLRRHRAPKVFQETELSGTELPKHSDKHNWVKRVLQTAHWWQEAENFCF